MTFYRQLRIMEPGRIINKISPSRRHKDTMNTGERSPLGSTKFSIKEEGVGNREVLTKKTAGVKYLSDEIQRRTDWVSSRVSQRIEEY